MSNYNVVENKTKNLFSLHTEIKMECNRRIFMFGNISQQFLKTESSTVRRREVLAARLLGKYKKGKKI